MKPRRYVSKTKVNKKEALSRGGARPRRTNKVGWRRRDLDSYITPLGAQGLSPSGPRSPHLALDSCQAQKGTHTILVASDATCQLDELTFISAPTQQRLPLPVHVKHRGPRSCQAACADRTLGLSVCARTKRDVQGMSYVVGMCCVKDGAACGATRVGLVLYLRRSRCRACGGGLHQRPGGLGPPMHSDRCLFSRYLSTT